jgi:dynein heavy chain
MTFEGIPNLPLVHSCNIFITMNPGYQNRTALPDNLKSLFRPCAMVLPDYGQIVEILLYSYGFEHADLLSKKLTLLLDLMSQQLSTKDHYDFGLRSIRMILSAARDAHKVSCLCRSPPHFVFGCGHVKPTSWV